MVLHLDYQSNTSKRFIIKVFNNQDQEPKNQIHQSWKSSLICSLGHRWLHCPSVDHPQAPTGSGIYHYHCRRIFPCPLKICNWGLRLRHWSGLPRTWNMLQKREEDSVKSTHPETCRIWPVISQIHTNKRIIYLDTNTIQTTRKSNQTHRRMYFFWCYFKNIINKLYIQAPQVLRSLYQLEGEQSRVVCTRMEKTMSRRWECEGSIERFQESRVLIERSE